MERKRRYDPNLDENQDGGRAIVIEEGIAALIFEYGAHHGDLANARTIDYELLRTIKSMTDRLEVRGVTPSQWQQAILEGWRIFRFLTENNGGNVECDLDAKAVNVSQL
jgi:hypothetical protein